MAENNNQIMRNRRLKLGVAALAIIIAAYVFAKLTSDQSGDWKTLAMYVFGTVGFIGGYLTLTDIFGRKFD